MILALHALSLTTSRNLDNWPIPKNFTGTSINQILQNSSKASYLKKKLNNHNIASIEQFLNADNTELLEWNNFHHNIKKIPRGRQPRWFPIIQDLITASANPSLALAKINPYTLAKWTSVKKSWIITNNLVIGKIYNPSNKRLKTQHFILQPDNTIVACKGYN